MTFTFLDSQVRKALESEDTDILVPWFLISSLLYYHADISIISDGLYDEIAKILYEQWDGLRHPHVSVLNKDMLLAGTGFALSLKDVPSIAISSAIRLAKETGSSDEELVSLRHHLDKRFRQS